MKRQQRRITLCDPALERELDALAAWHGGSNRVDAVVFLLRHISPRLRATNPADWLGNGVAISAPPTEASYRQVASPASSADENAIDLNNLFL